MTDMTGTLKYLNKNLENIPEEDIKNIKYRIYSVYLINNGLEEIPSAISELRNIKNLVIIVEAF